MSKPVQAFLLGVLVGFALGQLPLVSAHAYFADVIGRMKQQLERCIDRGDNEDDSAKATRSAVAANDSP